MRHDYVGESRLSKYDHQRSLDKIRQSVKAIKTRKPILQGELIRIPSRTRNLVKQNEVRIENKCLVLKLIQVETGTFSILKDMHVHNQTPRTQRGTKDRPTPFQQKQAYRIQQENERLIKVISHQRFRKKIF